MPNRFARRAAALFAGFVTLLAVVPAVGDGAARKQVTREQVTVRSFPDEYVIGNAFAGARPWTMDVIGNGVNGYRWGFLYGNFQGCGYITGSALGTKDGTAKTRCAANRFPSGRAPRVSRFTNGEVRCRRLRDGKCDGVRRRITCPTTDGYFNVRPWTSPSAGNRWDFARTLTQGNDFRFRYTAKGGYWALGRDPALSQARGAGKGWIFVPRNCVS